MDKTFWSDQPIDTIKQKGSYHMYHKFDGKTVAVGVLDILDTLMVS
jgi:hypothetical protein